MGTLTDDDLLHLLGEAAGSYAVPEDGPADVLAEGESGPPAVSLVRRPRVLLASAAAVAVVAVVLGTTVFGGGDVDRVGQLAGASRSAGEAPVPAAAGPESARRSALDGLQLSPSQSSKVALRDLATGGTAGTAASAGGGVAAAAPAAPSLTDGARIVKKGAIALIVDDGQVTPTLTTVSGYAKAVGGLVAGTNAQESGETPSGSVTLRVPVDQFEGVVAKVRSTGAKVRSATTSSADVTAQYADVEAQLKTLTAARDRFLEILSRARSIGDVLSVQQRVDDVQGRIDRLEGSRRVLAAQSDSATLEVTVTEADDPAVTVKSKPDDGLSKAFSDAWTGFTTGVEGLVRLSGRAVLLVLCLAVAYVVGRLAWRASRRRLV